MPAKNKRTHRKVVACTCRVVNYGWIRERRLYNLPLPKDGKGESYSSVTHVAVYAHDLPVLAYAARYAREVDGAWLAANGYKVSPRPHGEKYALFELGEAATESALYAKADVYVCSSRWTGKIDADFFEKPLPECGGKSVPNIFERLRPFFAKCSAVQAYNPVQMDFFHIMCPQWTFPTTAPIVYAESAIKVTSSKIAPNTPNSAPYRLGEFFCGPGGLACGALSARIENPKFTIVHAWANDYDRATCNTYAENICHDSPETVVCGDVRKLRLDNSALTPIDGFAFGFPCNDFSVVGEHKGIDGNYGPLYQYGVAVLRKFQPLWFVAENVGGLASANEGAAFKTILASMKDAGYRVYPHLYKFEDYGVPQTRHRIIIVGIRKDQSQVFYPPSPDAIAPCDNSSRAALEIPPIPDDAPNNERTAQNPRVVERLRYIRPGQNAFSAHLPAHLQLKVKGAKISQIYKRLDPTKPAYTVTGSGGGGTHIYHYSEPRALTNRERARLQTFPDGFQFAGSKESVRKQIGMAVPPRGARIIFEALLRTLAGVEYKHIDCNITPEGEIRKGS